MTRPSAEWARTPNVLESKQIIPNFALMTSGGSCISPAWSHPLLALCSMRRPRGYDVAQPSTFPEDHEIFRANMFRNKELASLRHSRSANPPGRPPLKIDSANAPPFERDQKRRKKRRNYGSREIYLTVIKKTREKAPRQFAAPPGRISRKSLRISARRASAAAKYGRAQLKLHKAPIRIGTAARRRRTSSES